MDAGSRFREIGASILPRERVIIEGQVSGVGSPTEPRNDAKVA
jgi:hypothetical protein